MHLDVADPASIEHVTSDVVKSPGGIDIPVDNAAVFDMGRARSDARAVPPHLRGHVEGPLFTLQVNGIAPGVVGTPTWDEVDALFARHEGSEIGEKKHLVGEAVPLGRTGRPDDRAGAAVFLASADADYVVAQTLKSMGATG